MYRKSRESEFPPTADPQGPKIYKISENWIAPDVVSFCVDFQIVL